MAAVPALDTALGDGRSSIQLWSAEAFLGRSAAEALQAITGQDCKQEASCWQAWWEAHRP